jgi:hypothetical protein
MQRLYPSRQALNPYRAYASVAQHRWRPVVEEGAQRLSRNLGG